MLVPPSLNAIGGFISDNLSHRINIADLRDAHITMVFAFALYFKFYYIKQSLWSMGGK